MTDILLAVVCLGLAAIGLAVARIHRRLAGMEQRLDRPIVPPPPVQAQVRNIYLPAPVSEPEQVRSTETVATPTEIIWGDPRSPAVSITPCEAALVGDPVDLPATTLSRFNHLVTGVPAVLAAAGTAGTYVMTFSPEVTKGLASGAMQLMEASGGGFRASALAGGKIVENGVLKSGLIARPVMAVAAVWQIAAMVTGQKFMAEIENRLRDVDAKLSTVLAYMEGDLRATIVAGADYLRAAHRALASGDIDDRQMHAFQQQLEALDVALATAHQSLLHRLSENRGHLINDSVDVAFFGSASCDDRHREIAGRIHADKRLFGDAVNAMVVRGMTIQLRAALGDRGTFNAERAAGLAADAHHLQQLRTDHEAANRTQIGRLRGSFWSRSEAKRHRADLLLESNSAHLSVTPSVDMATTRSDELHRAVMDLQRSADEPMRLAITIDVEGKITSVSKPKSP